MNYTAKIRKSAILIEEAIMDIEMRDKFLKLWKKYFNNAELPVTFYFSDDATGTEAAGNLSLPRCVIGALGAARE